MKTNIQFLVLRAVLGVTVCVRAQTSIAPIPETAAPAVIVNTKTEPVTPGKFQPAWDSLKQYQVPEWFRNAKSGIWACLGPQCEPEQGDWHARNMYVEGSAQNKFHVAHYGPPLQGCQQCFRFPDGIKQCWPLKTGGFILPALQGESGRVRRKTES